MSQDWITRIFWIIIGLVFILLPIASTDVGLPADEPIDLEYGRKSLDYFLSTGKDTSFANLEIYDGKRTITTQKYYGPLFEMGSVAVADLLPFNIYKVRHFLTGISGSLIILFTALLGWFIGDIFLALIVLAIMLASNAFLGQAMYNTKDVPFALGFIAYAWFFFKVLYEEKPGKLFVLGSILSLALAIGIRIGGILLIFYSGLFVIAIFISQAWPLMGKVKNKNKKGGAGIDLLKRFKKNLLDTNGSAILFLKSKFLYSSFIVATGTLLGLSFYPNFWETPVSHVVEALGVATNFPVKITLLFEGERQLSTAIAPLDYLSRYILITFPLITLLGLVLFLVFRNFQGNRNVIIYTGFIAFMAAFPIFYIAYSGSNVYNGWRHILFSYPFIVLISSMGIYSLIQKVKSSRVLFFSTGLVLIVLVFKPMVWSFFNHPYQYLYFNELIGKKKILKNYDTDYQQISSTESLINLWEIIHNDPSIEFPVRLYTNNEAMIYQNVIPPDKVEIQIGGFSGLSASNWDYAILSSIFLDPKLFDFTFPPSGEVLHEVKVDQTPINYLIKRENKADFAGMYYFTNQQYNEATIYLSQAYNYDRKNYRIWKPLAYCWILEKQNLSEARLLLSDYLLLFPGDGQAKQLLESIR